MSVQGRNWIVKKAGGLFSPPPSVFDFCIAGTLFVNIFQDNYKKQIFFVFYTIFLLCMTFIMKQRRNYKSIPLTLFILAGFIGVFTHSFFIYKISITFQYLNFYLLSEGFLYILFGVIFLMTAVKYSKNLKFLFLLLPIIFYPYLKDFQGLFQPTRFTIVFAVIISFGIYCLLKKRFVIVTSLLASSIFIAVKHWERLRMNFACRPDLWKAFILKIKEHPFIGHGFNKTLSPDNMTFHSYWGWLYNHNDYLALGSYLGIFIVIFLIAFILITIKKIGTTPYLLLFLTIAIVPFFQMTMFDIGKATGFLLITALCITQTHFKEEVKC